MLSSDVDGSITLSVACSGTLQANRGMAIPSGKRDVYFIEYALFSVAVGHNAFPN
ncbi:hypothetical protein NUKP79_46670 [Klebsiella quasipneumoniae]|nr:hypothetical protein NUKP2_30100 [Klebsiella quasipneumoniae]GKP36240.1 hypothetical protein NUKP28_29540 [Klebsiella quasipneumoniae]GKQ10946.1 hypothetical protein NUKP79_46670 [Klebsiella quasipneumoniae]GLV16921.1 hypothetical protein KML001_19040 [Klebsiella quasipneumoniae subsp. similipneumoniae]